MLRTSGSKIGGWRDRREAAEQFSLAFFDL
jgi:hypothetical protein